MNDAAIRLGSSEVSDLATGIRTIQQKKLTRPPSQPLPFGIPELLYNISLDDQSKGIIDSEREKIDQPINERHLIVHLYINGIGSTSSLNFVGDGFCDLGIARCNQTIDEVIHLSPFDKVNVVMRAVGSMWPALPKTSFSKDPTVGSSYT